eukprot:27990_1
MQQVINFREAIDGFNQYEFQLFCSKMYKQYNKRELIIKSLFYLFLEESKHNQYENILTINKIIKNIMDLRKEKHSLPKINTNNTQITITNLPSPLLSNIASYTTLIEQSALMTCNRYICSSLGSSASRINRLMNFFWPTHYKHNHGNQYESYQIDKLNRFRMVKQISFDAFHSPLFNSFPWNNLHLDTLQLHSLCMTQDHSGVVIHDSIHDTINILQKINLKRLSLSSATLGQTSDVLNLMNANRNIECLSLDSIHCEDIVVLQKGLRDIFSRVKGLIFEYQILEELIEFIGNQLISLHIHTCSIAISPNILPPNQFNNLKELCVNECVNPDMVSHMINSATNLCRFSWTISDNIDTDILKYILKTVVSERQCIQYLYVDLSSFELFKILYSVFMENKLKRNKIKLVLYFGYNMQVEELKCLKNCLLKFVKILRDCVTDDFMFRLIIGALNYVMFHEINGVLDDAKTSYLIESETTITDTEENEDLGVQKQFVICNRGHKIQGYYEQWMHECKKCNAQCLRQTEFE